MTKINRIFSYITTALLASVLTLAAAMYFLLPVSKLNQLEALIASRFIGEADPALLEDAAAYAMVHATGDRWSTYISASDMAQYQESNNNAYVGIGITISPNEDAKGFEILSVQNNGSAQAAGLLPGDIIIRAGGQSTEGMSVNDLTAIVRGESGTSVDLEILRDGETMSFTIVRTQILTEVVTGKMLEHNIGLVRIVNFNSRSASEAITAIEHLREQGAEALIFDVRNNIGGYVHELVTLLDYLLPEGVLFRSVDYTGKEVTETSDASFLELPMAVVCNQDSYSAAEFFPAAISEYGAGVIVGAPTCGKGYFQYDYMLSDGSAVKLSVGKYFTPKGNSLIDIGLQPDIPVEVTDEQYRAIASGTLAPEDDPQIQAAVSSLLGQ